MELDPVRSGLPTIHSERSLNAAPYLSAAGHITSSCVTRPGAAKFTALKRFPEADRTDGGRLILSIDEVCFTDCYLSDRPFSPP